MEHIAIPNSFELKLVLFICQMVSLSQYKHASKEIDVENGSSSLNILPSLCYFGAILLVVCLMICVECANLYLESKVLS